MLEEIYEELEKECKEILKLDNIPDKTEEDLEKINIKYSNLKDRLENLHKEQRNNIRIEEMKSSLACPKIDPEHYKIRHKWVFSCVNALITYIQYYH